MNPVGLIKMASSLVISSSVSAVVTNVVKNTTPRDLKFLQKMSIGIGTYVVSHVVSDLATKYVEKTVDETIEEVQKVRAGIIRGEVIEEEKSNDE